MSYGTTDDAEDALLMSGGYHERTNSIDGRSEMERSNEVWRTRTLRFACGVLLGLMGTFAYVSVAPRLRTMSTADMNLAAKLQQREEYRNDAKLQRQGVMGSDGKVMRKGLSDYVKYGFSAADVQAANMKGTLQGSAKILDMFQKFAEIEKKEYAHFTQDHAQYQMRYNQFLHNVLKMQNKGKATHGLNKYADISDAERGTLLGGFKQSDKNDILKGAASMGIKVKRGTPEVFKGSDSSVDWTGTLSTTYILDQGLCGCCWAISATEQMESDSIAAGISSIDDWFSSEYLMDCDTYDYGCKGGNPELGWLWYWANGGTVLASDYGNSTVDIESAYYGTADTTMACREPTGDKVAIPTEFITLSTEEDMKNHVLSSGPLSVCYAASILVDYTGGIVTDCGEDPDVDHCSTIVGYNEEDDTPYWIVRNSWGADWGESGYFRLAYGTDLCSISYLTNYLNVQAV